jgi:hypothetical protein
MPRVHERVLFSLLQMPCCHTLLCWVNPRMPNFCPECGAHIMLAKYGPHIMHQTAHGCHANGTNFPHKFSLCY